MNVDPKQKPQCSPKSRVIHTNFYGPSDKRTKTLLHLLDNMLKKKVSKTW